MVVTKPNVKCSFYITKLDKDGNEIYRSNEINNQVTDLFYQSVFATGSPEIAPSGTSAPTGLVRYMRLGKGTGDVLPESISLGDPSAVSDGRTTGSTLSNTVIEYNGKNYKVIKMSYFFGLGQFDSETFTQVGIFSSTSTSSLMFGQRLRDINGDPVSVTVLVDEQLVVNYTIRIQAIDTGEVLGDFNFNHNGLDYNAKLEAFNSNPFYAPLSSRPQDNFARFPMSNTANSQVVVRTQYQNRVEYLISHSRTIFQDTSGISNINIMWDANSSVFSTRLVFTPPLPKTNQNILNFSFRWTIKWRDL